MLRCKNFIFTSGVRAPHTRAGGWVEARVWGACSAPHVERRARLPAGARSGPAWRCGAHQPSTAAAPAAGGVVCIQHPLYPAPPTHPPGRGMGDVDHTTYPPTLRQHRLVDVVLRRYNTLTVEFLARGGWGVPPPWPGGPRGPGQARAARRRPAAPRQRRARDARDFRVSES